MRKIVRYIAIILITTASFLFSSCPEDLKDLDIPPYCVSLNNYMQVNINSDSYFFIGNAIEPGYLLKQNSMRQSRPLFIIAGRYIGLGIYYISYPFHSYIEDFLKSKPALSASFSETQIKNGVDFFCIYIGFLILNFLTLLCCLILFEKIIIMLTGKWKNNSILLTLLMVTLISNLLTRYFFFSAHQQLLNILTPLLGLYLGIYILKYRTGPKHLYWICFGLGIALLSYGTFLLTLPVVMFASLYTNWQQQDKIKWILVSTLMVLLFFAPTIAWILYLKSLGIQFYSAEVSRYHQLVWVFESLRNPFTGFLPELWSNTVSFLQTTGCLLFPLLLLISTLIIKKRSSGFKPLRQTLQEYVPGSGTIFLFIAIETIVFFWLLGYYTDRLTYSIAPLIICYSALQLNSLKPGKAAVILLCTILVVFHFYNVFFDPVYFSRQLFFR